MSVNFRPAEQSSTPVGGIQNSLFSKFRSHLAPRNRSITDFYIEPDDPWRSYFPGDSIKGTVVLTVVRPVRITHLVICLHGFVKVFKNNVPAGEPTPDVGYLGPGRGRRGAEYLGNGLATLFEDEVVLCGDGRLKEGIYKFRFEMGFPPYALPSSINFERGTISYMLTATLTKPTTMNPTLSCRRRVNLLENIDISPFPAPKARIVTLEPVSKRSKSKAKRRSVGSEIADSSPDPSTNSVAGADQRPPLSPVPSNVSSSSRPSNSSQSFQVVSDPSSSVAGMRNSEGRSITRSVSDKTIMAKTEVMRAGVLPGDTLPIKVTINHCKQVRSPHGVIVTLYRQGRIDLHPAIPIGTSSDGKKPVYEDVYPRSRTGLGGLTIGTSRTNSMFRKDLSQTFAPLIVDPNTLTAVVKTSIRIPESSFPTITRVPGSMINFRYYVEVVADLRGKLTSPERFLPRFNMVSSGSTFSPSGQIVNPVDTGPNSVTASWADNILDTDRIRREKGVIAVAFEVVVGTHDSQRGQNTQSGASWSELSTPASHPATHPEDWHNEVSPKSNVEEEYGPEDYGFPPEPHWSEYPPDSEPHQPVGQVVPPPQTEEPVDEKAQMRRAEETLLPSQPPGDSSAGPSGDAGMPTAPVLPEDDHLHDYQHVPSAENGLPQAMSAESVQTVVPTTNGSAPRHPVPSDDKQELERQRLMQQASAPDMTSPDDTGEGPSAPMLDDDDQLVGGTANGDESLPQYQR